MAQATLRIADEMNRILELKDELKGSRPLEVFRFGLEEAAASSKPSRCFRIGTMENSTCETTKASHFTMHRFPGRQSRCSF